MARKPRTRAGAPGDWTTDDWSTPPEVFDAIRTYFGVWTFDLDPCCRAATAKAPVYYDLVGEGMNGLELPWFGQVFVNMPYSDPMPWIIKAIEEVRAGNAQRAILLLPADVSTAWWRVVASHAYQYIWPGRIKFLGPDGKPVGSPKGGSIVAVFDEFAVTEVPRMARPWIQLWQ